MRRFWRWQRDLQDEIDSHLAMRAKWNQQHDGIGADQARALAEQQFGSRVRAFEGMRDWHPDRWLADFLQDARHALRMYRRFPGLTFAILATMALGIGAATTVFSIVDPLLFRSLPYRDEKGLVSLGALAPVDTNEFMFGGWYLDWRDHQRTFSSMTAMWALTQCDLQLAHTERVPCAAVQANFLPTFGVNPPLGRNFTPAEDQPHAPLSVLLSWRVWQSKFGGQTNAIGRIVSVDERPARVIGVLPANFVVPQGDEIGLLLPAQINETAARAPGATMVLRVFARLRSELSINDARTRSQPLIQRVLASVPKELRSEVHFVIRSVRDRSLRQAKLASWLLLSAVLFLELLGCLTIANLLLARAMSRREEYAMRNALGASRARLFRQSLAESLLLGAAGGIAGILLSILFLRFLILAATGGFMRLEHARVDGRILAFSVMASLLSTLLFGILPAILKPPAAVVRSWQVTGARTL